MATAQTFIKAALRLIGAIAPGETPKDEEIEDGLTALNIMLDSWSSQRVLVPVLTTDQHTLVAGTAAYTIATGADINTARPLRIQNAFVRDVNGLDYPVEIITREKYNDISDKTVQGRPYYLWYDNQFATGTINLYSVPDIAYTLNIDSWKALSSIATKTTEISFPEGYERAIKYNLAIELSPEYGANIPKEVAVVADETFTTLKAFNAPTLVSDLNVPDSTYSWYNRYGYYDITRGF